MRRARGFSIVELMVAVTLALMVTAAVLSVFVASRASYSRTSGTASVADGGRIALDFLQASVRSAGYLACNTALRGGTSMLNPAVFASPLLDDFNQALAGFEAKNTEAAGAYTLASASPSSPVVPDSSLGDWLGSLDPTLSGEVIKNNDVLVIYATPPMAQTVFVTSIAPAATNFTVSATGSLAPGGTQLIAISDCTKSVVMWSTQALTGTAPNITVSHDLTGSLNNSATIPANYAFSPGAQVAPVDVVVYYIGKGEDGDGALFMNDLNAGVNGPTFTAEELVPDIEAMQILYGIDTTGSQTVSDYVTADQVPIVAPNGWGSVVSVKIALLAASQLNAVQTPKVAPTFNLLGTTVTAPLDTRGRQVFQMTIGLRNQSQ